MEETQVDDSELIDVLDSPMPSEVFEMEWHRRGRLIKEPLRIRLLSSSENIAALREAQEFAKDKDLGEYGDIYREAQAHCVLYRAVCRPEEKARADGTRYYTSKFATADILRDRLTEPEQSTLLGYYTQVKAKYGPVVGIGDYSVEQWVQRLKGPMGADFLGRLDSLHWPALIFMLAQVVDDLSQLLGLTLTSSPSSSESESTSSTEDTGGSTSPQSTSPSTPQQTPQSPQLLSKQELEDKATEIFKRRPKD